MAELKTQRVAAVLFDKDGTLMDFQSSWGPWAGRLIKRVCGADEALAEAVAQAFAFDRVAERFAPDSEVIAGTPDEVVTLLQPHFPAVDAAEISGWLEPVPEEFIPVPVTGLVVACETLIAQGRQLAVVTNDFEAAGALHLEQMGLSALFGTAVGFDSGFGEKPAPGPCLGAADRLGVAPEACVMVGDSRHDLEAGQRAGMRTVAVLTGVAESEELAPHATVVLDSVADLPAWLASQEA